jgi:arylformamidase
MPRTFCNDMRSMLMDGTGKTKVYPGCKMAFSYIDISPKLEAGLAVYPGDQHYSRNVAMSFAKGDHLDLSSITTTLHIGAHADAPSHYHAKGATIEFRDLNRYIGPCSVVRVKADRGERIGLQHFDTNRKLEARLLLATDSFNDPKTWRDDFNSFSPELIHFLADSGVKLVGIDTPSVDPADSKTLESHQALYQRDLSVLEGLLLKDVPEGDYFLVALPLAISGADASPVRAALWPKTYTF